MNGSIVVGGILGLGPLLGIGVWCAEGAASPRDPSALAGTSDKIIWENNFWLNRLLIAILYGTFVTILVLPVLLGRRFALIDALGAFACGCLVWMLTLTVISWPHLHARFKDLQRFAQLRYGYNANSPFLMVSGSLFALGWIVYVFLRV